MLPALSLIKSNPSASSIAFSMLEKLSNEARGRVYGAWRRSHTLPLSSFANSDAKAELKFILRR